MLLQYTPGASQSDLGREFFFSERGRSDPSAELQALVTALDTPGSDLRCRYPARTLWLARQFNRPDWLDTECPQLEAWARLNEVEGISLILVSGHLGNPASSFGHSLMKVRYQGDARRSHLMDLGVNFGAAVPDNEPMLLYIGRGLFGGYDAAFSDNTFYAHDQTYSRAEFRDLWEYPLLLDEYQQQLVIYSLWELQGQKFDYYFLTRNCGYRLAQLVQLATGQNLLDGVGPWYIPVELFEDLEPDSYGEPVYHPSSQRVLIAQLKSLAAASKAAAQTIMEAQLRQAPAVASFAPLESLAAEEQQKVLDALLAFYEFQDVANSYGDASPLNVYRRQALALRFNLPIAEYLPPEPEARISAKDTDSPASLQLGVGQTGGDRFTQLNYTGVNYDAISYTDLLGSELQVLDVSAGLHDGELFLQELTLARVTRILDADNNLPGYWPISWRGAAGWMPETYSCFDCVSAYAMGGLGLAKSVSGHWLQSAFINLIYYQSFETLVGELEWQLFSHSDAAYSLNAGLKYGSDSVVDDDYTLAFFNGRLALARNWNLKLQLNAYLGGELDDQALVSLERRF